MTTNNDAWSLGTTPNKSLDPFGPSIPIHFPGDPLNYRRNPCVLPPRPFAAPTCPTDFPLGRLGSLLGGAPATPQNQNQKSKIRNPCFVSPYKIFHSSPHGRIELCTFTQQLKNELFTHLRSAFERRLLAIPGSTDIREDLHSIYRVISNNGQISYRASHSPDGHSDRCTALALDLRAAESAPVTACASSVGPKFRSARSYGRYV